MMGGRHRAPGLPEDRRALYWDALFSILLNIGFAAMIVLIIVIWITLSP